MTFWKKKFYVVSTEADNLYWDAEMKLFQRELTEDCKVSSFRSMHEIDEAIEYLSKFHKERSVKHISIERVK